jgi:hypothetical protein
MAVAGDHAQNEGEDHRGEQTHQQGIEDVHGAVLCGFLVFGILSHVMKNTT